jgi:CheY-like chemotaxis protein
VADVNFVEDRVADPAPVQTPRPSVERQLTGVRVLLVEDSEDNRTLIRRLLRGAGAVVDAVTNGRQAVATALAGDYDVVLMDLQMPEMDGFQATALLRERGYLRPIVALTAHAMKEERERSLKVGCNDHLTKPVNRALLISKIAAYAKRELS